MTPPVFAYLDTGTPLLSHEHLAILHHGALSATCTAGFVSEGLRRGNWCCYLAPPGRREQTLSRLRELGVDVEPRLRDRTLQFPRESLDTDGLRDWARALFVDAEAAHAPGVLWLEEDIWPAAGGIPVEQFFEFHARLNYLVKHYPSVALCQYDVERLELSHLFSAIAVHRHLLVEGTLVRDNPFYLPAEKFLAMNPEHRQHDLCEFFQNVGFDVKSLLSTLAGYGQLQEPPLPGP